MSDKTIEERIAEKESEDNALRARLAEIDLDGPYEFTAGSFPFSGRLRYVICMACGAMVRLDDAMESPDMEGVVIERGVYLHSRSHEATP